MKSFCMFREHIHSPIFESQYNFNTGLIDNVPSSRFSCIVPDFFIRGYDLPPNYGLNFSKEYYILALYITNGLVAFNFYDVGVTVVSASGMYVVFFEGHNIKFYEDMDISDQNVFGFEKFPIGIYKTVVRQLDVAQHQCYLYIDSRGDFVTDKGVVTTGITTPRTLDDVTSIKGSVTSWRNGFDGILIDDEGTNCNYTVKGHTVRIFDK